MIILPPFLWQGKFPTDAATSQGVKHLILVDATWRFAREMAAAVPEKESGRREIPTVINSAQRIAWATLKHVAVNQAPAIEKFEQKF